MTMLAKGTHFLRASVIFLMLSFLLLFLHPVSGEVSTHGITQQHGIATSHASGIILPLPFPLFKDIHWIILDEHNQKIHEFTSDSLAPWQSKQWFIRADGHEWIIDHQMKALTPVHYESLDRIGDDLVLFREDGKSGVMKPGGQKILMPRYDSIRQVDGLLLAGKGNAGWLQWQVFSQSGEEVNPFLWENVSAPQHNGLIPVKRNGYWGFINRNGEQVVECVYQEVGEFTGNKVPVKFKDLYGIIDDSDSWVVNPGKTPLSPLNDRLYLANGTELTTIKNYETGTVYFTNNPIEMKKGYFVEALDDGTFWKINYSGRIINSEENLKQYEEIRLPSEGFIAVKIHGRYGFIDEKDRLRIANRYDDVKDYNEGLAGFKLMNRWGFLDKLENIVVQPLYDYAGNFEAGISIVRRNGKYGAINKIGDEIVALEYDAIERQENGRFIITRNGKKGLINAKGRVIVFPKYEELQDLTDGQVIVKILGKYGVISRLGDDLIPAIYDQITYDPFNGYYLAMKKN